MVDEDHLEDFVCYTEPLDDNIEVLVPDDDHGLYAIDILDPSWVANEDISGLGDLVSVLSKLSRGARVPLEYMSHTDRHRKKHLNNLPFRFKKNRDFDFFSHLFLRDRLGGAFHENIASLAAWSVSSMLRTLMDSTYKFVVAQLHTFSSLSLDSFCGISPERLLCERSTFSRFPKLCGINPEMSLYERPCFEFFQFTAKLCIPIVKLYMKRKSEDELTRDSFMPVSQEMKGEIHQDCSQRDPRP
ncbi:putative phospholipase A(1) [Arabidopsis thaliana]